MDDTKEVELFKSLREEMKHGINQDTKDKISDKKIKRATYLKLLSSK